MTVSWTDAAIEAAIRGWFDTDDAFRPRMRAALDAALAAQGMTAGWINRAVDDAYQEGPRRRAGGSGVNLPVSRERNPSVEGEG